MKAPRVAPLGGASTSTVAPVDVAHTYGSRHTWRDVSMHCGGHDADERRFKALSEEITGAVQLSLFKY